MRSGPTGTVLLEIHGFDADSWSQVSVEPENHFFAPVPVSLDENSSAAPSYVVQREVQENSTRAAALPPPLVVVAPTAPERDGIGESTPV